MPTLRNKKRNLGQIKKDAPTVRLPTQRNVPSDNLGDYSLLLYGRKKIGKTTFASQFPNAFFLSTEPGTEGLSVYKVNPKNWEELRGYVDLILEGDHDFKTVVIDIVDYVYDYAYEDTCARLRIKSPTEMEDFGATWRLIKSMATDLIKDLISSPYGVVMISHEDQRDYTDLETERAYERVEASMNKNLYKYVEGVADIIGYYTYRKKERVIKLQGTESLSAGNRIEGRFLGVDEINMGSSSQEGYRNFIAAFNNEQPKCVASTEPRRGIRRLKKGAK